jgi:hypothetical protein
VSPNHKGITNNKKLGVEYPNTLSYINPGPFCEGLPISEPPDSFTPDCDEEEEKATEETLQSSTSRNPEFSLNVNSPQSHNIIQNEIPDFIKDLQLTNNTAEPFIQVYNSGIFWMTCESESTSLTAKRF